MSEIPQEISDEREAAITRVATASCGERVLSGVGWWAPEVIGATTVATAGAVAIHPLAAAIAYTALGARIGWAHLRHHPRRTLNTGIRKPAKTTPERTTSDDADNSEEVA